MTTAPPIFDRLSTLGDRTRSRLLALLDDHELTVTELHRIVQLPQSTVSGHLKILADNGWVASRADGKRKFYRVASELDDEARALWALILEDIREVDFRVTDRERARSVLAARDHRAQTFISEAADRWDSVRRRLYGVRSELLPLLGLLGREAVVADLGTGVGQLAAAMAPFAGRVVAVDRSPEMLSTARRRLSEFDNVDLREGDLERLPLHDGEVDVAILNLVLHFVADPAVVLGEASRVLAPAGRLVVVDLRPHDRTEYRDLMGHVWMGFEDRDLRAWMAGAGMRDINVQSLPHAPDAEGPGLLVADAVRAAGPGA